MGRTRVSGKYYALWSLCKRSIESSDHRCAWDDPNHQEWWKEMGDQEKWTTGSSLCNHFCSRQSLTRLGSWNLRGNHCYNGWRCHLESPGKSHKRPLVFYRVCGRKKRNCCRFERYSPGNE